MIARLSIGLSSLAFSCFQAALALSRSCEASTFGSYDGLLTRASTLPVFGSSATTAPFLFPSAWYAACWAAAFRVRLTLAPC